MGGLRATWAFIALERADDNRQTVLDFFLTYGSTIFSSSAYKTTVTKSDRSRIQKHSLSKVLVKN